MLVKEIPEDYAYLAHHGIKGQRWGIRRYQNADGTLTKLGRRRLGIDKSRRQIRKEAKEKRKQAEAAQKAADERAKLHEEMVRDPNKLYKYRNALSKEEIDSVMRDIEFNRKIKEIKKKDVDSALTTMQQVVDFSRKTSDLLGNAKSIYNLYAEAYNTFSKSGKKLTKIGEKKDDDSWERVLRTTDPEVLLANQQNLSNAQLKDLNTRVLNAKQIRSNLDSMKVIPEVVKDYSNQDGNNKDWSYVDKVQKGDKTYYVYDQDLYNKTFNAAKNKSVVELNDFRDNLANIVGNKMQSNNWTGGDQRKLETVRAALVAADEARSSPAVTKKADTKAPASNNVSGGAKGIKAQKWGVRQKESDHEYVDKFTKGDKTYYVYDRDLYNRTVEAAKGAKMKDINDFRYRLGEATIAKKQANNFTDVDRRRLDTINAALANLDEERYVGKHVKN